jgi:hypothetical protein
MVGPFTPSPSGRRLKQMSVGCGNRFPVNLSPRGMTPPGEPAREPVGSRRPGNPPAGRKAHRRVLRLAARLAGELDPKGRSAIVLAGSWARGDAHEWSDLDLWVVGRRRPNRILLREGYLVCVRYSSPTSERREMRNPARWDGAVPGWRGARILQDPNGVAARLKQEAREFRWTSVRGARDRYIANQLAAWAEEVGKLLRALETGERETAAVQRNLLANYMAFLRALPLERLWDTENGLWERVGRWAGPEFRAAQRAALGTDGGSWRQSCEGALRLYALTAQANERALRGENRRIVAEACRRAGYPRAVPPSGP